MNRGRFAALAADLDYELAQLDALVRELAELRARMPDPPTSVELRAAGSILHDFYSGVERMFQRIATAVDQDLPGGSNWHIELLNRMSYDIPTVRPAVITADLRQRLSDYLRFRHLFRNIYGRDLRWELMRDLVEDMPAVEHAVAQAIREFTKFLHTLAATGDAAPE